MEDVPNYCGKKGLQKALRRIIEHPQESFYEHHVGSWANTMLAQVFTDDKWIITPEQKHHGGTKKPDLVVEDASIGRVHPWIHLYMELKKHDGDHLYEALHQVVQEIGLVLHSVGNDKAFVVVQRGTKIAFFQFHNNSHDFDLVDFPIPHIWGCISLTEFFLYEERPQLILQDQPQDLERLVPQGVTLGAMTVQANIDKRAEAIRFTTPCVFDLTKHQKEINFLFHYIESHQPGDYSF
ncbi:MAG: hypothetical protein Q9171_006237 [Xanthocarpia ochracea]